MPFALKTHNWATARNFTYSPKKPVLCPRGSPLARLFRCPLLLEPCARAGRCRVGLALISLLPRECGNPCLLRLEAVPYGCRSLLIHRDGKQLIAVIERIEARVWIARDAIVR